MNWETYSKRRKMDLKSFLNDSSTEEEALKKFARKGINDFPEEEVKNYFKDLNTPVAQETVQAPQGQKTLASNTAQTTKNSKAKSGAGSE